MVEIKKAENLFNPTLLQQHLKLSQVVDGVALG